MGKLKRAEALLQRLEGGLLVGLLSGMVALSFLQVLLRQFFGTGLLWADTLLRHLVLWVGFLGAALSAADNKHFAWEAAAHKGGRTGAAMHLVARLSACVISLLLARAAWSFLLAEKAAATVLFAAGPLEVPAWWLALIIPAGFVLVLLHTAVKAVEAAASLRAGGEDPA